MVLKGLCSVVQKRGEDRHGMGDCGGKKGILGTWKSVETPSWLRKIPDCFISLCMARSQNHGMVCIGIHPIPIPSMDRDTLPYSRASSNTALNTSRDEDSTIFLGNLCDWARQGFAF